MFVFSGASANAQKMADVVDAVSNGHGRTSQATQQHDFVSRWVGGNQATSDFTGGSMLDRSHGSYTSALVPVGTMIDDNKGGQIDIGAIIPANWGDGHYSEPRLVVPTQIKQQQKVREN